VASVGDLLIHNWQSDEQSQGGWLQIALAWPSLRPGIASSAKPFPEGLQWSIYYVQHSPFWSWCLLRGRPVRGRVRLSAG